VRGTGTGALPRPVSAVDLVEVHAGTLKDTPGPPHRIYRGVVSGAMLDVGDPRLTLRNTMMKMANGDTVRCRDDSREHLLYYLKSWNAWVEGRSMNLLRRSPDETMPKISNHAVATGARAEA
jgi:hypothetical protein